MTITKRRVIVGILLVGAAAPLPAAQDPSSRSSAVSRSDAGSATSPPPPVPPLLPPTAEYRIGHGDKLRIDVYKDEQLSQSVQVRPDGRITLPLIGDLVAVEQTPIQLRDTIAGALKEYVTNPTVTVIVVEATAATAYVMGEVNHPGPVNLGGGPMTVLQALAMVGGLKDFADVKNIRILRRSPTGVQAIPFNYKEAIRGSRPVYLQTGDTVVVPD